MCKVAGITKITNKNREKAWAFMKLLGAAMTPGNDDGLGYAAFDENGKLFGERWLLNKTAFTDLSYAKGLNAKKMNQIYSFFGDKVVREQAQAIILHTRFATCGKGIANVHPFIDDEENPNVAIIHNGVIFNEKEFKRKYSTCDSEVLAHLYKEFGVSEDINKVNDFVEFLHGWYTVLNLTKDANGRMVMDAYTDTGRLGSYFIPELDTRVFSTYSHDIKTVAKFLGMTCTEEEKFGAGTAVRYDVLTGEVVDVIPLKEESVTPNIVHMEGNFDDENFVNTWFTGRK